MIGTDLPEWRRRNRYTQDGLKMALGIGSRQTIISWEKSPTKLSRLVQLALMALEKLPEAREVDGRRAGPAEHKEFEQKERDALAPV